MGTEIILMKPINYKDYETWCDFMEAVGKDPSRIVSNWTIGKALELSEHVKHCENCRDILIRVTESSPSKPRMFSIN